MDIKTADQLIKKKQPVLYNGNKYSIKELVIWYDTENQRQCSCVLQDDKRNIYRVKVEKCEEVR